MTRSASPGHRNAYERHRDRRIAEGRWHPWADAEPARRHVRALGQARIGAMRVAELAGVSKGMMTRLLYGSGGRPPSRRIRPEAAAAILAVRAAPETPRPGAFTEAAGTRRRLQALVACGWSIAALSARLGISKSNAARLFTQQYVTYRVARQAAVLYEELWDQPPPRATRWQRAAATKAAGLAEARGWPPPQAWDDDEIDDPAARPAAGWKRREADAA